MYCTCCVYLCNYWCLLVRLCTYTLHPVTCPLTPPYQPYSLTPPPPTLPQVVAARFSEILRISQPFLLGLLSDRSGLGKGSNSAPERAAQLRELISELGPAFIKVGQAVSVRPDLLQPAYLAELVKLQDQVPPFDSSLAVGILTRELGDPTLIFEDMDVFSKPVAAASLGQVYKARLKSGQDVAVKLQRPNMLVAVSLDLYIIRKMLELGEGVESVAEECKSFIGVIDNWAGRFIDELDYVKEVQNSNTFRDQMGDVSTTLGDAILVPRTYDQYCTGVVLTSEWIVGTKLSAIGQTELGKETKKKLLRVLLNSYLVQLLETGFLHADPHPGNFLITPEGKLCILDYGLMTEVQADKRYALLEYVSHLLAKDYDSTLQDLVTLEFIPPDVTSDPEKRKVVAPLLASGKNPFPILIISVEELSKQYPIVIPAYFGLIVRAFGALEGIGLSIDPAYSITSECFPYLARRLLSDDSERVRKSLRTFLYGKNSDFLDIDRLDELAKGFQTFSAAAAEAASGNDDFRQLQVRTVSVWYLDIII
ncbi:kinase-like domain-containing protein [Ochromonadaceae sp. CCMP2298]|nr:kinase-like domain-containing protein [Ochromonadaceae sp. CCMP2298]